MSTCCTIWYSTIPLDVHLYKEAMDGTIWVEVCEHVGTFTFQIPQEMMQAILGSDECKKYAEVGDDTSWIDRIPSILQKKVETESQE